MSNNSAYKVDQAAMRLALHTLAAGENALKEVVASIRNDVIVPGYDAWNDAYGERVLGKVDTLTTELDEMLAAVHDVDVKLQKAVNILIDPTKKVKTFTETPSGASE